LRKALFPRGITTGEPFKVLALTGEAGVFCVESRQDTEMPYGQIVAGGHFTAEAIAAMG